MAGLHRELSKEAEQLPLPVAQRLHSFVETGDVRELFFSVEALLRTTALIVKAAYLVGDQPPTDLVNNAIRQYLVMPSMGGWHHFLRASRKGLPGLTDRVPGIEAWLDRLLKKDVLAVVELRNVVHGHAGAVPPVEVAKRVIEERLPTLVSLCRAAAPLRDYPLIVWREETGFWFRAMGAFPDLDAPVVCSKPVPEAPAALIEIPGEPLPLFPLVLGTYEGFEPQAPGAQPGPVLLFDGVDIDRKRVVYLGSFGRGREARWFDRYRKLVEQKRVPMVPARLDEVPSGELRVRIRQSLAEVGESFDREQVSPGGDCISLDPRVSGLLDEMLAGTAEVAVLTGEAGVGKSTHLRALAARATADGDDCLFFRVRSVLAEPASSLKTLMNRAFENLIGILEKPEATLRRLAIDRGREGHVILIFDGLDEVGSFEAVGSRLRELLAWVVSARKAVPKLKVIVSIRAAVWHSLGADSGNPMRTFALRVFRPTGEVEAGGEGVLDSIELGPLEPAAVGAQYESIREHLAGHAPLTSFEQLSPALARACRIPRAMMRLLRQFNALRIPPSALAADLWLDAVDRSVYERTGKPGRPGPAYPDRVELVDAMLSTQWETGSIGATLSEVRSHPLCRRLVAREGEWRVLVDLQSEGILRVEGDRVDPSSSPGVFAAEPELLAALHARGPNLRSLRLADMPAALAPLEGTSLHPIVQEALVLCALDRVKEREAVLCFSPALAGRVLLELLYRAEADAAIDLVGSDPPEGLLAALLVDARSNGAADVLEPIARHGMTLPATPERVRFVAHVLRQVEAIEEATSWLEIVSQEPGRIGALAALAQAAIERDKGLWNRAVHSYTNALALEGLESHESALALAARGESWIWLRKAEPAIRDLDEAARSMPDDALEQRCNLHLKRAIAMRLQRRPIPAVRELSKAREIAMAQELITEANKIELELGLVAMELGSVVEAEERVGRALVRHKAEGHVKGLKKAWYCLGVIRERSGRASEAREAYRESLGLNERYFDLLGLELNHRALARLESGERRDHHEDRAAEFRSRRERED